MFMGFAKPFQTMSCALSECSSTGLLPAADSSRFFLAYRDVACTIYPVVPDTQSFEDTLTFMLSNRSRHMRDNLELDPNKPYGVSLPWLSLVFAVFASGAQSSDRPAKERELTSQVYGWKNF